MIKLEIAEKTKSPVWIKIDHGSSLPVVLVATGIHNGQKPGNKKAGSIRVCRLSELLGGVVKTNDFNPTSLVLQSSG